MTTKVFWRETKRGLKLVERNIHFETNLGAVEIDFAWNAAKDKFNVWASTGVSEWDQIATGVSLEEGKRILIDAMENGVTVRNRWFNSRRDGEAQRTRRVESKFEQLRRNMGSENLVLQLEKIVGLPGKRKGVQ